MPSQSTQTRQQELAEPLLVKSQPQEQPEDDESSRFEPSCWDHCILWIVLPILLFVQFGIAYWFDRNQRLPWGVVNASICLFVVASYLFRRTLTDRASVPFLQHERSMMAFLIPEVIMDVLLLLVLLGSVEWAFFCMVGSTVLLSLYVVVQSLCTLYESVFESEEEDDDMSHPLTYPAELVLAETV